LTEKQYCTHAAESGNRCNRYVTDGNSLLLCPRHFEAEQKRAKKAKARELNQRKDVVTDTINYGKQIIKSKVAKEIAELQARIDKWKADEAAAIDALISFEPGLLQQAYTVPLQAVTVENIIEFIRTNPTTSQRLHPTWLQRT